MKITFNKLNDIRIRMIKLVRGYGYNVRNNITFTELLDLLERIPLVHNNTSENYGVEIDDIGFVTDVVKVDTILQISKQFNAQIPEDIKRGYYKLENGKLVLDEERKRILE